MIDALILAAGLGRRMGSVKPAIRLCGVSILGRLLSTLREAGMGDPVVILGHGRSEVEREVDLNSCRLVINPDPSRGLGSSLREGLAAIRSEAAGTLVFHADMPLVAASTIRAVLSAAENRPSRGEAPRIVVPTYRGRRGFPVYLPRGTFGAVAEAARGDVGARGYLAAHPDRIVRVAVEDPGCVVDLDTAADIAEAERMLPCR